MGFIVNILKTHVFKISSIYSRNHAKTPRLYYYIKYQIVIILLCNDILKANVKSYGFYFTLWINFHTLEPDRNEKWNSGMMTLENLITIKIC